MFQIFCSNRSETLDEIKKAVKRMKKYKDVGLDGLPAESAKAGGKINGEHQWF